MRKKRYLTAFVSNDGVVSVMGNDKDLKYALEVVKKHNQFPSTVGQWKVFELGKEIKIRG